MSYKTNTDNIYAEGATVYAKAKPEVSLTIMCYYQRIYYCAVKGDPNGKQLAYFERELIAPAA